MCHPLVCIILNAFAVIPSKRNKDTPCLILKGTITGCVRILNLRNRYVNYNAVSRIA